MLLLPSRRVIDVPGLPLDLPGRLDITRRAQVVVAAALSAWRERETLVCRRAGLVVTVVTPPALVYSRAGYECGVEAFVAAEQHGERLLIDPHRVIVNPPLRVRPGSPMDPLAAYKCCLLDSVAGTPGVWR